MVHILHKALKKKGPCLSSELSRFLENEYGLSPEAARQKVSRGAPGVNKLRGLSFPKRAVFVYLESEYMSYKYSFALNKAIIESNSAYSHALTSILSRGGIVEKDNFKVSCGAPIKQKKKISYDILIERFTSCRVVDNVYIPGIGECLSIPKISEKIERDITSISNLRAKIFCEKIILEAARDWARNLGLVSYNKVEIRGQEEKLPTFGTYHWDMVGPSYLSGVCGFKEKGITPGFFLCDIHLGKKVGDRSILPFLQKVSSTQSLKNLGNCIYMHIADNYTESSFRKLKSKGLIPATPKSLFGEDVAHGLKELFYVLRNPDHTGISKEQYNDIFEKLSFIKGIAGNLRGALFEFVSAEIVRSNDNYTSIDMNMIIKSHGKDVAESDIVIFDRNKKVCFVECKGHGSNGFVDIKEIRKWLSKRIPTLRQYALSHPEWKNLNLEFRFWTTGKICPEGHKILKNMSEKTNKYEISFKDGDQIIEEAKKTKDKSLVDILESHFIHSTS